MPVGAGTLGGAAQGAATGAAIAGPWGAVVGGIIGGIGGLFSDKAAKYARKAAKKREQVGLITTFLQRRALIQSFALQRSQVLALGLASGAGAASSGIQGTIQSLQAQTESNLDRNAEQVRLERVANKLYAKAGKASAIGSAIGGAVEAVGRSGISFGGGGYSAASQRAGTGSYVYGNISTPMQQPAGALYTGGFSTPQISPPTTLNTSPFI